MMSASLMDMRQVYSLKKYHEERPEELQWDLDQAFDDAKPECGFLPYQGLSKVLYGSPEWWSDIENGTIDTMWREGIITDKDIQGMDDDRPNTVYYIDRFDGKTYGQGMLFNKRNKRRHYKLYDIGHYIKIRFVRVEYKKHPLLYAKPDFQEIEVHVSNVIVIG